MEILPYKKGDEANILDLFQQSFKKSLSKDFWTWRFGQNPFFEQPMINLMWDGDILAGHYAVSASETIIEGRKYLTCLSGTTMTHPDYEGKGIFSTLSLALYDRVASDHGIHAVLGFPNKSSHYGLIKKIHWKDVCIVPTLYIEAKKIKNTGEVHLVPVTAFTDEHASFITGAIQHMGFSVYTNRSSRYLNWRYIDNPVNTYSCFEYRTGDDLKGIIISKVFLSFDSPGEYELDVVEMFCEPDITVITALMAGLNAFYLNSGIVYTKVNTWLSLYDPRHVIMERLGFSPGSPLTFMCAKAFLPGTAVVYDARNWYISMGDSDVY